jgi:transposase-like protein
VPKHVRRLEGLGANVLSLYAKGLTTGEIQAHLAEIYDTEVSRETISKITELCCRTCSRGRTGRLSASTLSC